jgi:hypothetical protein
MEEGEERLPKAIAEREKDDVIHFSKKEGIF